MITKIKNIMIGMVFISLGIWCFSLRTCSNIKILRNSSPVNATVSQVCVSPDITKIYKVIGTFDITTYYEIREITRSDKSRSEELKGFLYRFHDNISSGGLLIRSDYTPVEMGKIYRGEEEIIITLKKFKDSEARQVVSGEYNGRMKKVNLKNKSEPGKAMHAWKNLIEVTGGSNLAGYYGEMSSDIDDAKSGAIGSLVWDSIFGFILLFLGIIVLIDIVKPGKHESWQK